MRVHECLIDAIDKLRESGIYDAKYDAQMLLAYVLQVDRLELTFHREDIISREDINRYNELIVRRTSREPLQHIIGYANFYGYSFRVSRDVLIPRFDTEVLVERLIDDVKTYSHSKILDMCTGSGCIATTTFLELSKLGLECDIAAADISDAALSVARDNVGRLIGRDDAINFIKSDIYSNITDNDFDVIVSNPPYIRTRDIDTLDDEVRLFDPHIALDGGEDGLSFYHRIISGSVHILRPGGYIYLEIGYDQGSDVLDIMSSCGYRDIEIYRDLAGYDRVIGGRICSTD